MHSDAIDLILRFSTPSVVVPLCSLAVCAAIFTYLERRRPANPNRHPKRSVLLNITYWFFTQVVTKALSHFVVALLVLGTLWLMGMPLGLSSLNGFGPISTQPIWLQTLEMLILADFIDYWTHRMFHTSRAWKFHAVHHSVEEMTWHSAYRMHPFNDCVTRIAQVMPMLLLGFSPLGIVYLIPIVVAYVILLHTNVKWDFGFMKYVFVSPTYHRWHHSSEDEAVDKNFSGMFPIWDLLFGTIHMPGYEAKRFGVRKDTLPESLLGQLAYPFRGGPLAPPSTDAVPIQSH